MNSVVCPRPGELELRRIARPVRADTEVRVRIRRVGICGTDFHIFEGKHPYLSYPRIIGHELAAEVIEAPTGSAYSPGEHVIINPYLSCGACRACRAGKPNCCTSIAVLGVHRDGGMCEEICVPEGNLVPSSGLSLDACATVEFLAIGAHAVRRGEVGAGDLVLIAGAGPIGLGVAIFARLAGATVFILDLDAARLTEACAIAEGCQPIAADAAADAAIRDVTDGDGFEAVFDATGNLASIQAGFARVAHGGRYVLVSVVNEMVTFSDPEFHKREMALIGSRNATSADFATVIAAYNAGHIPLDRIITHRSDLARVAEDLPRWSREKTGLIKALVSID
ncbi:MAG: zinc-binding alcohol dehydrogenase family protein [Hoeflea sp.]|uniref:zinc-binding alcohol dehydrogenase family protein n=1 Tax=Hoeflea sp. TaxID=1940281 RepID=UPI001D3D91AF|nr:zinc-binding alcohol dehydrogenase family protein [Hoeflea sp.]MBU4531979.1 zinc-binding alcohol dehydrogenase family protein [Alphaproteobacteria bacterium]MBU4546401.1 zinc-binding alcohol dehydrogenase family protein [Alphaproteobacteria bacterium]MBU4549530.1 zinc-binding alcohol dehydrogenase family protein [Alphaproteobacteria bacterium]MBV1722705.1 zinc-binding alcohol dehydrogenase family protein [Hoeflea sp.]MBV1782644.1 zinc-binding alcohol dehydrogenase family protein [Hoeflea sp